MHCLRNLQIQPLLTDLKFSYSEFPGSKSFSFIFFFSLFPGKEIPLFSLRIHRHKHIFQNSVSTLPWSVPHQISPCKSPQTNLLQSGNTPHKHWSLMIALRNYILNWVDIQCHLVFKVSILILFMCTHMCVHMGKSSLGTKRDYSKCA